jgi:putative redox protein
MPDPSGTVVVHNQQSGLKTDVEVRGHSFIVDEPLSAGGTDLGPKPYDLLVAALGTCVAITARLYANRKGWPLEDIVVRLRHRKISLPASDNGGKPDATDVIEREIEMTGPLTEEQRARILAIAERCPVKLTLERGVRVTSMQGSGVFDEETRTP